MGTFGNKVQSSSFHCGENVDNDRLCYKTVFLSASVDVSNKPTVSVFKIEGAE